MVQTSASSFLPGPLEPRLGVLSTNALEFPPRSHLQIGELRVFLHPQCACSFATLSEVAKISERNSERLRIDLYFFRPTQADVRWVRSNLWFKAMEIRGATLHEDMDGLQAKANGAYTSGAAQLTDIRTGALVYEGGLTPSRGEEGANIGTDTIQEFFKDPRPYQHGQRSSLPVIGPVYGCVMVQQGAIAGSNGANRLGGT